MGYCIENRCRSLIPTASVFDSFVSGISFLGLFTFAERVGELGAVYGIGDYGYAAGAYGRRTA